MNIKKEGDVAISTDQKQTHSTKNQIYSFILVRYKVENLQFVASSLLFMSVF